MKLLRIFEVFGLATGQSPWDAYPDKTALFKTDIKVDYLQKQNHPEAFKNIYTAEFVSWGKEKKHLVVTSKNQITVVNANVDHKPINVQSQEKIEPSSKQKKDCLDGRLGYRTEEECESNDILALFPFRPDKDAHRLLACGIKAGFSSCQEYDQIGVEDGKNPDLNQTKTKYPTTSAQRISSHIPFQDYDHPPNIMYDDLGQLWVFERVELERKTPKLEIRQTRNPWQGGKSTQYLKNNEHHGFFDNNAINVDMIEDTDRIFLFFTETVENKLVSRIGTICKNEQGGEELALGYTAIQNSFQKATINCPIISENGKTVMSFDKLVSIKKVRIDQKDMLIGIFATVDQLPGSAMCIFSIDDLNKKVWETCEEKVKSYHTTNLVSTYQNKGAIYSRTLFNTGSERDTLSAFGVVELEHGNKKQNEVYFVHMGTSKGKLIRSILIVSPHGDLDLKLIAESTHFLNDDRQCENEKNPKTIRQSVKKILFDTTKNQERVYTVFDDCITFANLYTCDQHECSESCTNTNEQVCIWEKDKCVVSGVKPSSIDTSSYYPKCSDADTISKNPENPLPDSPESTGPSPDLDPDTDPIDEHKDTRRIDESDAESGENNAPNGSSQTNKTEDAPTFATQEANVSFFHSFTFADVGKIVPGFAIGVVIGVVIAFFACVKKRKTLSGESSHRQSHRESDKADLPSKSGRLKSTSNSDSSNDSKDTTTTVVIDGRSSRSDLRLSLSGQQSLTKPLHSPGSDDLFDDSNSPMTPADRTYHRVTGQRPSTSAFCQVQNNNTRTRPRINSGSRTLSTNRYSTDFDYHSSNTIPYHQRDYGTLPPSLNRKESDQQPQTTYASLNRQPRSKTRTATKVETPTAPISVGTRS